MDNPHKPSTTNCTVTIGGVTYPAQWTRTIFVAMGSPEERRAMEVDRHNSALHDLMTAGIHFERRLISVVAKHRLLRG